GHGVPEIALVGGYREAKSQLANLGFTRCHPAPRYRLAIPARDVRSMSKLESARHVGNALSLEPSHQGRIRLAACGDLWESRHFSDRVISVTESECHGEVLG